MKPGSRSRSTTTFDDPVTVEFATADGTAEAGADYTATSGTLTIDPGSTTNTIAVPIVDDGDDEPDETFSVSLSNARNATIAHAGGTGTIVDNDEPPPTPPALSIGDVTVAEDAGEARFTVTLDTTFDDPGDGRIRHRRRHGGSRGRLHRHERYAHHRRGIRYRHVRRCGNR